jgi:1,2-diacylglycerol 3-beta-galactosyltransferase
LKRICHQKIIKGFISRRFDVEITSKKVLILTADAGYGHRSAAKAVSTALGDKFGASLEIEIVNPLDDKRTPFFLRGSQRDYDKWVREVPELYKFGFEASDSMVPKSIMESVLIVSLYEVIKDLIEISNPDIMVLTYPLYQAPVHAVLAIKKNNIPVITILTDLASVHHIWFNGEVDSYIVPNEIVKNIAIKSGIEPERINVVGIPVNPRITKIDKNKKLLRQKINIDVDKSTIFVVGGKRVENLLSTVNVLNHSGFDIQMIISAGNDKTLFGELNNIDWHIPTFIYEYIEDMPTYLLASDLIICKAGGLIVTEALACGTALIMISVIPGQETGNAAYVEAGNAGVSVESPIEFLEEFSHFLINNGQKLKALQENALKLGNANAAYEIATIIWDLLVVGKHEEKKHVEFSTRIKELLRQNKILIEK